ncbi:unnamed protein product [Porites lobata]|uniref:MOSC domain-containing protein n=1 Tax=Porites lobata TaxID=104759 RepID=A0ABN8PXJ6_9CNID|nr:unnamed protein product [Porites lobata]
MGNFPSRSWRLCVPFSLHFVAFAFLWWKHRKALKGGNLIFEKIGHVAGIIFYPVKSCRGISLETANCLIEGLEDDRRWVVVDNKDEHIRCYLHPVISQVTPRFEGDQLCLDAPGMQTLKVNRKLNTNEYKDLRVLRISSISQYAGDEAAAWFSTLLNVPGCKMYQIHEPRYGSEEEKWGDIALPGDKTGYASITSYLMTTEASLVPLNEALPSPVGMDRFRPNIVIGGTEPFAEDHWDHKVLKIGDVTFRKLKDCGRCPKTIVDPERGVKDGHEPLETLRKFRSFKDSDPRHGKAPFFGAQMAPDCEGTIEIGDPVFLSC